MQIRRLPADLAVMVGLTILTLCVVFLPFVRDTPARIIIGITFVVFVPGYVLIAVLYPKASEKNNKESIGTNLSGKEISLLQRTGLSFGLSVVVVSFTGLGLNYTPFGLRLVPILVSLAGVVLVLTAVATWRRWELPPEERFTVRWRTWARAVWAEFLKPDSRGDAVANIVLISSVLLAVASVGYAVTVPTQGQMFTEFYFLDGDEDGMLVSNSSTDFTVGESQSFTIGIRNQEHQPVKYTVVAGLHRVTLEDDSTQLVAKERLRTFETRLKHNETWKQTHTVAPRSVGERLRLTYLLYRGDPPTNPTRRNAYRELYIWINIAEASQPSP